MSYIVTMLTKGGIVMCADRQIVNHPPNYADLPTPQDMNDNYMRQLCDSLYEKNKNFYKVATKTARKLFAVGDNVAFSTGQALHTDARVPVELLADLFCRKNTLEKPADIAKSLFDFMSSKDDTMNLTIHLAGYDKNMEFFIPEFYEINILQKTCKFYGSSGFAFAGANTYIEPFVKKITDSIWLYTVQDAIDICCFAIDMSRKLGRYVDFQEYISPDEEVIAITMDGLQWVKKAKLEVGYAVR